MRMLWILFAVSLWAQYTPPGGGGGSSTPAFSSITAGTNTAALVIGSGGSLGTSGTGTISATPPSPVNSIPFNNAGAFGGFGSWDGTTLAILEAPTGNLLLDGTFPMGQAAWSVDGTGFVINTGSATYTHGSGAGAAYCGGPDCDELYQDAPADFVAGVTYTFTYTISALSGVPNLSCFISPDYTATASVSIPLVSGAGSVQFVYSGEGFFDLMCHSTGASSITFSALSVTTSTLLGNLAANIADLRQIDADFGLTIFGTNNKFGMVRIAQTAVATAAQPTPLRVVLTDSALVNRAESDSLVILSFIDKPAMTTTKYKGVFSGLGVGASGSAQTINSIYYYEAESTFANNNTTIGDVRGYNCTTIVNGGGAPVTEANCFVAEDPAAGATTFSGYKSTVNGAVGKWGFRSTGTAANQLGSTTFSALVAYANAAEVFCSDCTVTSGSDNTCAGSGGGAFAYRVAGAWKCFI